MSMNVNACCSCHRQNGQQVIPKLAADPLRGRDLKSGICISEEMLKLPERDVAEISGKPVPREKITVTQSGPTQVCYTGYARIDNAILDALQGQSEEVRSGVYDIIRNDLLPHDVHGLSEEDRKALNGLGVAKAEYIADNFLDKDVKDSFMEAIRSAARIGLNGKRESACQSAADGKSSERLWQTSG